jgi:alanyl-tRNA synthetase
MRVQSRTLRRLHEELAAYRAAGWRKSAETVGRFNCVLRTEPEGTAADVKAMARTVVEEAGFVAAFVGGGTPAPFVIARSADVDLDAGGLMREATTTLGGRGGGRPELAQGGVAAAPEAVIEFVRRALSGAAD